MFENKKVLIISYFAETGLFRLANSLRLELEEKNNEIFWMPKNTQRYDMFVAQEFAEKYKLKIPEFSLYESTKTYEYEGFTKSIYNYKSVLKLDETYDFKRKTNKLHDIKFYDSTIEDAIISAMQSNYFDYVIFFEFLGGEKFLDRVLAEAKNTKIIDVPMFEWADKNLILSGNYKYFDEIWCTTNYCKSYFEFHNNKKLNSKYVTWDFAKDVKKVDKDFSTYRFLFMASTNKDYSVKNENLVLDSFIKYADTNKTAELYMIGANQRVGLLEKISALPVEKRRRIITYGFVEREQQLDILNYCNVLLMPSEIEGLGLPLYEARNNGCKILTTDIGVMKEFSNAIHAKCDVLNKKSYYSKPIQFARNIKLYDTLIENF